MTFQQIWYFFILNQVSYIHRIGRTARAGKSGSAISILEHKQVKWFKNTMNSPQVVRSDGKKIKKHVIKEGFDDFIDCYQKGLKALEAGVSKYKKDEDVEMASNFESSTNSSEPGSSDSDSSSSSSESESCSSESESSSEDSDISSSNSDSDSTIPSDSCDMDKNEIFEIPSTCKDWESKEWKFIKK